MSDRRQQEIRRLFRHRPRSRLLRASALVLAALAAYAWASPDIRGGALFSSRRLDNLRRFLREILPYPLQDGEGGVVEALGWWWGLMLERGLEAAAMTLALSVAAIVLAAAIGGLLAMPAARTLATPEPYTQAPRPPRPWRRGLWWSLVTATRAILIFLRAIPEYIWGFLLLALLGPTAWPIILALALHNGGILGKLYAESLENLDPAPMRALRGLGGSRRQLLVGALWPLALPRFLLYFFYRWETCVRDATVLGMLGVVSLGFWIVDARARNTYDEMIFFVLLGAALVWIGDLASAAAREAVRRSG